MLTNNIICIPLFYVPLTGIDFACGVNCVSGMCSNAQLNVRQRAAGASPAVSSSDLAQLARRLANSTVWSDIRPVYSVYHFKGVSPVTFARLGTKLVSTVVFSVRASH